MFEIEESDGLMGDIGYGNLNDFRAEVIAAFKKLEANGDRQKCKLELDTRQIIISEPDEELNYEVEIWRRFSNERKEREYHGFVRKVLYP